MENNRQQLPVPPGFRDLLRFFFGGPKERWPKRVAGQPPRSAVPAGDVILYIGHASFLLSLGGRNILLDPVFGKAGPFGRFGPARHLPPGIAREKLPRIDAVLQSHDHYDHLEVPTLRYLQRRDGPLLLLPEKCARALPRTLRGRARELAWWESTTVGDLAIQALPARHFSGRGLFDRNRSRWCGFLIEQGATRIFFAGDTAYGDHFSVIGERCPGITHALLPIGAYRPEWMMHGVHIGPPEALRAFLDLGAARCIACHHRTFHLSWEGQETPERELLDAAAELGLPPERVLSPREGEWLPLTP